MNDIILQVKLEYILPNPRQPRQMFDKTEMEGLVASIREYGILEPLVAVEVETDEGVRWMLITGERRLRAAKLAGLETAPVIVREAISEQQFLELALIENLQRSDLNPIEEAQAYQKLTDTYKLSQDQIAVRVGKDRSTVTNKLRLLRLPGEIQFKLMNRSLSERQAMALLPLYDLPETLTKRAESGDISNLRPSAIENKAAAGEASGAIRELIHCMIDQYAPGLYWRTVDVFAVPVGSPATCGECKRLVTRPGGDLCGDFRCYEQRLMAHSAQQLPIADRGVVKQEEAAKPVETINDAAEKVITAMAEIDGRVRQQIAQGMDAFKAAMAERVNQELAEVEALEDATAPAAQAEGMSPVKPQPTGQDWRHSTVVITITLMPEDDDPMGRPVMVGLRANQEMPRVMICREKTLGLAGYLAERLVETKAKVEEQYHG